MVSPPAAAKFWWRFRSRGRGGPCEAARSQTIPSGSGNCREDFEIAATMRLQPTAATGLKSGSEFCFHAASTHETPAAKRFEEAHQPHRHQYETHPQLEVGGDDSGDEQKHAQYSAHQPSAEIKVATEEPTHAAKVARRVPKATATIAH